ncbi:glycosyltransferase [Novosphingobium sp. RD2P27]|uniref:Glycosyltransferase n=1 Tax=Novosphingobium kalidii TaxID=3230299 RepID=A0ABV2D2Q6_9SPHN
MSIGQERQGNPAPCGERVRLSVIIKALNEEKHIEAAITSALAVVDAVGGEVILADSASSDRTVPIAQAYPVRIVQLEHPDERCCGIGPQLGYQHARGEFVWIADGDQVLNPVFAQEALALLLDNPDLAGVAGTVNEAVIQNLEFERRSKIKPEMTAGIRDMKWLSQGGIYRRKAIEEVGHFSDRNLHSYEEYDLGRRLRAANWRLVRIATSSCEHFGHSASSYKLLWRRFTSKYAYGSGEALRAAMAQGEAVRILKEISEVKLWLANLSFWMVLATAIVLAVAGALWWPFALVIAVIPILAATLKTRDLRRGFFTWLSWNVFTLGFVMGFFRRRTSPGDRIASRDISGPNWRANPASVERR